MNIAEICPRAALSDIRGTPEGAAITLRVQAFLKGQQDPWADIRGDAATLRDRVKKFEADNHVNCIVAGLFLGGSEAFATTLNRPCQKRDEDQQLEALAFNNAAGYDAVITACPLSAIRRDWVLEFAGSGDPVCIVLPDEPAVEELLEAGYSRPEEIIVPEWHHIGEDALEPRDPADAEETGDVWRRLVNSAARPYHSSGANSAAPSTEHLDLPQDVSRDISRWFESVFKVMDRAVYRNERVLVHCQQGRSRSAAIVTAYLINRFGLGYDQAISAIRAARPSVAPKLETQLRSYADHAAIMAGTPTDEQHLQSCEQHLRDHYNLPLTFLHQLMSGNDADSVNFREALLGVPAAQKCYLAHGDGFCGELADVVAQTGASRGGPIVAKSRRRLDSIDDDHLRHCARFIQEHYLVDLRRLDELLTTDTEAAVAFQHALENMPAEEKYYLAQGDLCGSLLEIVQEHLPQARYHSALAWR